MPTASEHSDLLRGLEETPKRIPVSFLYDARGSSLYGQITELPSYYPYREERVLLEQKAAEMAHYIPKESVVVELGCGSATKTRILLQAVARLHSCLEFVGIDVSEQFLNEAKENITTALSEVDLPRGSTCNIHTVCADYLAGLREVRQMFPERTLVLLWLGSSVGNLKDEEAKGFFRSLLSISGPHTRVLLATDLWKSKAVLHKAYDDPQGVTAAFIKNGLRHALRSLGVDVSEDDSGVPWDYEAVVCSEKRRVEMWVRCLESIQVKTSNTTTLTIQAGERIFMEISRKFTDEDVDALAHASGFVVYNRWSSGLYGMQLLVGPTEAMQLCWDESDSFFESIRDWMAVPIEFRNPFCFYYGHLAAFAALKLLEGREAEKNKLDIMYSRGIDPQLLDPSKCHAHPEAPLQWPSNEDLKAYVSSVRNDILCDLTASSELIHSLSDEAEVQSRMWKVSLILEHEVMHQETLSYMKAQDDITLFRSSLDHASENSTVEGKTEKAALAKADKAARAETESRMDSKEPCKHTPGLPPSSNASNASNATPLLSAPAAAGVPWVVANTKHSILPQGLEVVETELDVVVPCGPTALGVAVGNSAPRFVWDNEGPDQGKLMLHHGLAVSSLPVTVLQFHCFLSCMRGYSRPELWQAADWLFLQKHNHSCPATWTLGPPSSPGGERDYWVYDTERVFGRGGDKEKEGVRLGVMRPWQELRDTPVMVSLAEAEAFCRAVGGGVRIMSEAEWNRVVQCTLEDDEDEDEEEEGEAAEGQLDVPSSTSSSNMGGDGSSTTSSSENNGDESPPTDESSPRTLEDDSCLCCHAKEQKQKQKSVEGINSSSRSSSRMLQVLRASVRSGGWEWTGTTFEPFKGFKPMKEYPEYSADFFDGLHYVLKGSSPATHPAIIRDSFRNFYQRQYPFVFAKFRCCKELPPSA